MIKKISTLLLVFALMFTSFGFGFTGYAMTTTNKGKNVNLQLDSQRKIHVPESIKLKELDKKDKVRVIVELQDAPAISKAISKGVTYEKLDKQTKLSVEADLIKKQQQVKKQLADSKISVKYFHEFITVFNGFSAEVNFGDLEKISKLKNVKKVYITNEYERPSVKPEMIYSKELVQAQEAWSAYGFKGEGMVVGIIDTGIDYTHKDFVLSEDTEVKLTKEDVESTVNEYGLPGKYYTDKVPYGYNYMDQNDEIRDLGADASMHGQHVAGTVAANGDEENGGIQGVAPEAQLLALKVFGNDPEMPSTFGDVYVKAIDDAIKLGADVINMSLGAVAGFVSPDDPEQQAVKRAVDSGVLMSISAGNSNHFGDGAYTNNFIFTSNPDYGVSGDPGLSYQSLQVASFENSNISVDALEYVIDGVSKETGFLSASSTHPNDIETKEFEVLDAGLGYPSDFQGKDFTGKYALVKRGDLSFVEKALNAQSAGAAGVIIYNNTDGVVNMATDPAIVIPQLFMLKPDGDAIKAALDEGKTVTINFTGKTTSMANPEAGQMSSFTSWGLTPNLDFKPEITAPGGNILSTLNDDQYGIMSGTSMAAPHVSGGAALVLERVDNEFGLTNADRVLMAKNLLMNTAMPVKDDWGYYVSPRRQGAGLMQLNNALSTPVTVTEKNTNEAKVALKEVTENTVSFELVAENFSDTDATYDVATAVLTDFPYNANLTTPNLLGTMDLVEEGLASVKVEVDGEETNSVTVPANGTANIKVTINIDEARDSELQSIFTNGYWLDGYVTLVDPTEQNPSLTVPYAGFKGEWDKAPIVDAPMWDPNTYYGYTGVLGTTPEEGNYDFLGFVNEDTVLPEKIAFSPNGDGLYDNAVLILSFLRNAKDIKIKVLDENKNVIRTIKSDKSIRKNFYNSGRGALYYIMSDAAWDGKINGKLAPEGQYYLQVDAVIDFEGAERQTFDFPVKLDVTAPTANANYDEKTLTVTLSDLVAEETDVSHWVVTLNGEVISDELPLSTTTFKLSKKVQKDDELAVEVYDYAGNKNVIVLTDVEKPEIPELRVLSPETYGVYNTNKVTFSGDVSDKYGIESIKVNGEEVKFPSSADGNRTVSFEHTLTLEDGAHVIQITATNVKGEKAEVTRRFMVDTTAASLDVKGLKEVVPSKQESLDVTLNVKDNFDAIRVLVNGDEVYHQPFEGLMEERPFNEDINVSLPLNNGENEFEIKVIDIAGNETVKVVKVKREKLSGWVKDGGKWYYYNENEDLHKGWLKDNNKWYFLDGNGVMQTGWVHVDGKWYYLAASGVMQTGWLNDGGKWYYLASNGAMQTGWVKDGGKWYYLAANGVMQTGWVKDGGKWYYLAASGAMQTGWVKDGGKWYYLAASGAMQTGWLKDGGNWYYLASNGAMQTGWVKIDGKWYYFKSNGVWDPSAKR